jgi:hypothetical protein
LNPDFFIFKNKESFKSTSSENYYLNKQFIEERNKNSRLVEFLKTELNEISETQESLRETLLETSGGLRIRVKIKTSFEIIARSSREIFVEIMDEGKNLDDLSTQDLLELLNFVFDEDAESLGKYLESFKDDELRASILYPKSCDGECVRNFQGLYSTWRKILKKVFRKWNRRFKRFRNCDRKRWKMTWAFNRASRKVPIRIRRVLRNYFQYIVVNQICKTF